MWRNRKLREARVSHGLVKDHVAFLFQKSLSGLLIPSTVLSVGKTTFPHSWDPLAGHRPLGSTQGQPQRAADHWPGGPQGQLSGLQQVAGGVCRVPTIAGTSLAYPREHSEVRPLQEEASCRSVLGLKSKCHMTVTLCSVGHRLRC